jgi:hypothetical protein
MISNAKYLRSKSSSQLLTVLFASLAPNSWWPILTLLSLRLATSTRTCSFPACHPAIVPPTGGQRTYHIYGQLFYTPHPSLALLTLPDRAVPWTVIKSQAAAVTRAWSGRILMPSRQAMDSSDRTSEETDSGLESRAYHTFKYPEDLKFLDWLNNWVSQAETVNDSSNQIGKTSPRWASISGGYAATSPLGSSSLLPFFARSAPNCGA